MAKNKNITKLLCPVCGTEHYINKQYKVKCLCMSNLIVLRNGKIKTLIREDEKPKPEVIKCKDCVNFSPKEQGMGDCTNLDKMRRNINGECLTVCKNFMKRK